MNIRDFRKRFSLSQGAFGKIFGISQGGISQMEAGFTPVPDIVKEYMVDHFMDEPPEIKRTGKQMLTIGRVSVETKVSFLELKDNLNMTSIELFEDMLDKYKRA